MAWPIKIQDVEQAVNTCATLKTLTEDFYPVSLEPDDNVEDNYRNFEMRFIVRYQYNHLNP